MNKLNNKDKIGVCMVIGAYYPEIAGGAIQCFNLIDSLKEDFDFYVIATYKISSMRQRIRKIFMEENIGKSRIFRINLYPGRIISEILSFFALLIIFFKIKNKVEIFHMHGYTRKSYLITFLAKIFHKKTIVKTTLFGIDDPLSIRERYFISSALYSFVNACIVTSPAQRENIRAARLNEDKIYMIPNGVNLHRFNIPSAQEKADLRQEMNIQDSLDVILLVGSFSRRKGIDVFAESLLSLPREKLSNLFLIFVGSRDDRELEVDKKVVDRVYDVIDRLSMKSRCLFVDSTHEIYKYFRASDIFIFPSRKEGLPNALLEAMACGLLCIVNRFEGVEDYIIETEKDGYLLDSLDPDSIVYFLKRAIGNKSLQSSIGHEAHLRIKDRFNMDKIKSRYKEVYTSLLEKG